MTIWINKSPSNVPGISDQSKVNYIEVRQDKNNASNLIAIATHPNAGSWSSYLGYSQDYGDTWNWLSYLGGSGGVGSLGDEITDIENGASPQSIYNKRLTWHSITVQQAGARLLAKISNTLYTVSFVDWATNNHNIMNVEYISSTSINSGSPAPLPLPTNASYVFVGVPKSTHLSTNRCATIYIVRDHDAEPSAGGPDLIYTAVTEATTGSINSGTPKRLTSGSITPLYYDICNLDENRYFVAQGHPSGSRTVTYRRIETTGRAATPDNEFDALDPNHYSANAISVATVDASTVLICLRTLTSGSGQTGAAGIIIDVQGNSAVNSGILPANIGAAGANMYGGAASKISANKVAWAWRNAGTNRAYLMMAEIISSTSINWGSAYTWISNMPDLSDGDYSISMDTFGEDDRLILAIASSGTPGYRTGAWTSIVTVTGTCPNFGPLAGSQMNQGDVRAPNILYKSNGSFVTVYHDDNANEPRILTLWAGGGGALPEGSFKALSGEISAGGNYGYLTFTNGTNIQMSKVDLSTLTEASRVTISQGTVDDIDAKTYWAGVRTYSEFTSVVDDEAIWVFGRMDNISAPLTHLAKSVDGGQTFTEIETGLGVYPIGAIAVESDGRVNAIVNINNIGGYYRGTGTLTAITTIPFPVDHRALHLSSDNYLIAGASINIGTKIAYTKPGAIQWYDLTKNHVTAPAITGIGLI